MEASWFGTEGIKSIACGSDEAGRGPLAGPVVAAAVILPEDFPLGEAELREATSPEGIVKSRATTGSANPDKVAADLVREREALGLVAVEIQKLEQRRSLAEARLDLALCKTLAG